MSHEPPTPVPWYVPGVGDTVSRIFVWRDSSGVPMDLTDYTVTLIVDHSAKRTEIDAEVVLPATDGKIKATIDDSVSGAFTVREGKYRVVVTDPDGEPRTIVFGPLVVAAR